MNNIIKASPIKDFFDEEIDIQVIVALAYQKKQSLSILSDERKVLDIIQGYGNRGFEYVVEEVITNPGKRLNNLVGLIN